MQKKKKFLVTTFLTLFHALFFSTLAAGGAVMEEVPVIKSLTVTPPNNHFYIKIGSGASFSTNPEIHVDNRIWDFSPQGYNHRIGTSEFYEVGVGYNLPVLGSLEIATTVRPSYDYKKFQHSSSGNTPGFFGDKTRFFKLTSQSVMLNLLLDPEKISHRWVYWFTPQHKVQPILGGGIGIAYNTVKDFHAETTQLVISNPAEVAVAAIMNPHTRRSFAYQFLAGMKFTCHEQLSLDLGYRFFNGGNFSTNSYLTNIPAGFTTPFTVSPWEGKLKNHELYVNLSYAF